MAITSLESVADMHANKKLSTEVYETQITMAKQDGLSQEVCLRVNTTIAKAVTQTEMEPVFCVFNTPELLETILVHLDFTDILLRANIVCRDYSEAIHESPTLLRKIFRIPDLAAKGPPRVPVYMTNGIVLFAPSRTLEMGVRLDSLKSALPLTNSLRNTYISQPSVTWIHSQGIVEGRPSNRRIVAGSRAQNCVYQNEAGITFGQAVDWIADLEDKFCMEYDVDPYAVLRAGWGKEPAYRRPLH